ncbi:hypothetical protein [Nocardioides sp.]|uniref:hypothetical protein n=1 Tax=Nocardioides sp. TaxID=35761 RepID=UPI0035B0A0AB
MDTMTPAARRLTLAMTTLLATDAVGGVLAVTNDVNTWRTAWSGEALLAAPLPMIVAQLLCTVLAVRSGRRWAAVPAYLLALACLVSVISGFFDGGLANDALGGALVAFQVVLLTVTGAVGLAAVLRGRELHRRQVAPAAA